MSARSAPDTRNARSGWRGRFGETLTQYGLSPVEVRGFEPLAPTLRMSRPHPSDQGMCALTWGYALIASHRFAWFRIVSRTKRARSCGWARSVRVSTMLHTVDQNDLVIFKDLTVA